MWYLADGNLRRHAWRTEAAGWTGNTSGSKEKMESRGGCCKDLDQEEKAMVYLSAPI